MQEPVVCIFPHSDNEFATENDLRDFLLNTLPEEEKGRYLLRKLGWKDKDFMLRTIPGSLVLFRKKGVVVGEAVMISPIQKLERPESSKTERGIPMDYYHEVLLDTRNIKVYPEPLPVTELERWLGRKLYPQYYAILGTPQDYRRRFPK